MRLACIPLILLGGYFGYRFASELYGQWSGVTFLILWTFSPLILGWGATICPGVHASSLGIVGLYTFWRWLKAPTWGKAVIAGLCLSLLPLTKTTWIIAFPIWLLIYGIWRFLRPAPGRATNVPSFGRLGLAESVKIHTSPHPNPLPMGEGTRLPFRQFVVIILLGIYMINMGYGCGQFRFHIWQEFFRRHSGWSFWWKHADFALFRRYIVPSKYRTGC